MFNAKPGYQLSIIDIAHYDWDGFNFSNGALGQIIEDYDFMATSE
jgi:hypothetical protein